MRPGRPARRLPRWEDTARIIAGVIKEACAHERLQRGLARPARAGRPPLAQPQAGARAGARTSTAGGRSRSSISAAAPAPICAPPRRCWGRSSTGRWSTTIRRCSMRRSQALDRLGRRRRPAADEARPVQGRQAHHGRRSAAPIWPAIWRRRWGRAPISSPPRPCSIWCRRSSSPSSRRRWRAAQVGVLHRAHLRRRSALDAGARGRLRP